jgi:hypothetical protein
LIKNKKGEHTGLHVHPETRRWKLGQVYISSADGSTAFFKSQDNCCPADRAGTIVSGVDLPSFSGSLDGLYCRQHPPHITLNDSSLVEDNRGESK